MSLLDELMAQPGVRAAVSFSYHGDAFEYQGELSHLDARRASVMARAHNMGVHMQSSILQGVAPVRGFDPLRGWLVRGPRLAVCGMANVFCFLDQEAGSINAVMALLHQRLADAPSEMVY